MHRWEAELKHEEAYITLGLKLYIPPNLVLNILMLFAI